MATVTVGPLTRIEGHLDIEASVSDTTGKVTSAKSSGTMFRGFETMLKGRDPLDALHYTQRICGVCPTSHGMAAALTLDSAMALQPANNGRIMRNLVLGADFVQSHILHFYHLAALDYVDTTGLLEKSPWVPRYVTRDMIGGSTAASLVSHYVQALTIRRQAHQMGALFGGKLPISPGYYPGGFSDQVTSSKISQFKSLLTDVSWFVTNVYLPDAQALAAAFPSYYQIGKGCGNLLAYGVFDLNASGSSRLFKRGRYTGGQYLTVDPAKIAEYVKYSKYTSRTGLNPSSGETTPSPTKSGAYSWIKAPRYDGKVHEVGPLARMWVNGDYRRGISVIDRILARAYEAQKICNAMSEWIGLLSTSGAVKATKAMPASASGIGLTEAPRGAVGHWLTIANSVISRYQVISSTSWNASPRDDQGQLGPIEQALIGTPVADPNQPIELLRVVHSFDPCMACSVHLLRPNGEKRSFVVNS